MGVRGEPVQAGKKSVLGLKAHIPRSEPPFQQKKSKERHLHFSLPVRVVQY